MSRINGIGGVAQENLTRMTGNDSAVRGTAQAFSASYRLALANASLSQEAATAANSPSPANGSRHIPLAGQQQEGGEDIHEVALGLRAYRQQLLASNIANADTPGYKAVDIDFQAALRSARTMMQGGPVKLSAAAAGHLSAPAPTRYSNIPLKYHVPQQASIDGNTVEMDVERAKFTGNALMYQFAMDRVSGEFKDMLALLKNLT
ncbi:MAG: flagellar basal body rod protein FlgB [Gammaproteobacteria bacterium]|nr:flagellar basal body rod protein FlgB [Gammaproteobacteria bacterium]